MSDETGRRFFVEQALTSLNEVKGQGQDYVSLSVARCALQYVLDRWDEWDEVERQQLKGGPNGQTNVGAGGSEADRAVRCDFCGSVCEDVQVSDDGERTGTEDATAQGSGGVSGRLIERRVHDSSPLKPVLVWSHPWEKLYGDKLKVLASACLMEVFEVGLALNELGIFV